MTIKPTPQHILNLLAVRTGHKPIDIDDMLAVCIPGGSSCDPQDVADSIREYWRANGGGMSTQIKAMSIQPIYRDLWPELTKAACAMVHAHMDNETMVPALDDVAEQFPDLTRDQLTCLWMGVNAKDREGLVGA